MPTTTDVKRCAGAGLEAGGGAAVAVRGRRHSRSAPRRLAVTVLRAFSGYRSDHGPQMAAALAFHVLLSLFPIAILLVAGSAISLSRADADALLAEALDGLPLTESARTTLELRLREVTARGTELGLVGAAALAWSGSAVMAALRTAVNVAYDVPAGRSFVRGKLVDLGLSSYVNRPMRWSVLSAW
jgi:membrane protein